LVQVCYECGSERPAYEIKDDFAAERFNHSLNSARAQAVKLSSPRFDDSADSSTSEERIAVGQRRTRKFLLVK